jgi:hypothetical protein
MTNDLQKITITLSFLDLSVLLARAQGGAGKPTNVTGVSVTDDAWKVRV